MTPETTAGKALLDDLHEPKGPCYASPACEHGEIIAAIEAEARRTVVAELRAEVEAVQGRHVPITHRPVPFTYIDTGEKGVHPAWYECVCCESDWPCEAAKLASAIDRRLGGSE